MQRRYSWLEDQNNAIRSIYFATEEPADADLPAKRGLKNRIIVNTLAASLSELSELPQSQENRVLPARLPEYDSMDKDLLQELDKRKELVAVSGRSRRERPRFQLRLQRHRLVYTVSYKAFLDKMQGIDGAPMAVLTHLLQQALFKEFGNEAPLILGPQLRSFFSPSQLAEGPRKTVDALLVSTRSVWLPRCANVVVFSASHVSTSIAPTSLLVFLQ